MAENLHTQFGYRVVKARWSGKQGSQYAIVLQVIGNDDIGIVTNITSVISKEKRVSMRSLSIDSNDGRSRGHYRTRRRHYGAKRPHQKNQNRKRREKCNPGHRPVFVQRIMKKPVALLFGSLGMALALQLTSCHRHTRAEDLYQRAEEAFVAGQYHTAQSIIDSIPLCDSLAFEWIRKSIVLNQRITLEQNRHNLASIDSLLPTLYARRDTLLPQFIYHKVDNQTSDGYYTYRLDRNAGKADHSCLRVQITDDFEAEIISVYCGKRPLNHVSAKAALPDGTYALTPTTPYDGALNYRFTYQNGNHCELVRYIGHELRSVFEIIVASPQQPIKISYEGEFPYSYTLSDNDRKAIEQCFKFISLQRHIDRLEQEKEIARKTIELLQRQLASTEPQ